MFSNFKGRSDLLTDKNRQRRSNKNMKAEKENKRMFWSYHHAIGETEKVMLENMVRNVFILLCIQLRSRHEK